MHASRLPAIFTGTSGLVLCYATILIPMYVGVIRYRGRIGAYFRAPLLAIGFVLVVGIVSSIFHYLIEKVGITNMAIPVTFGMLLSVVMGYFGGGALAMGPQDLSSHQRGAVVSPVALMPRKPRFRWPGWWRAAGVTTEPLTLAGVPVAAADETKHFKFLGTTGTGKSTAIRELLSVALARGDRAIIADPDGGYLRNFYDASRGDVVLNPFEADGVKWELLREVSNEYDVDQLARSLIPDASSDRTWSGYARTFFTAVIQQARLAGITDDAEIVRLLTTASVVELRLLLANTFAEPFLADGADKMFGSLRGVTTSAVGALRYTTRQQAAPFSVRQWIREGAARQNGGAGGVLFLPYKAGEIAALRTLISAWLRIGIFEAMDRPEGDQRLWFIVDELDALGEIDGLKDALARLRKFGGRCVLGFQSISQVSGTYGKGAADTIVENCGNTLILRCSASEQGGTSQFASRLIGQREVVHTTRSSTQRPGDWSASTTTSQHRAIEPAIMASEIERLPDLQGFLKLASTPNWMAVSLSPVSYPVVERPRRAAMAPGPVDRPMSPPTPSLVEAAAVPRTQASVESPAVRETPTPDTAAKRRKPRRNVAGN